MSTRRRVIDHAHSKPKGDVKVEYDKQLGKLMIKLLPIASLKPNPGNPRRHDARQIRQLTESIQAFGFLVPVLTDSDCNLIAGHGRLLAAKRLGMTAVPAIEIGHLNPDQIKWFTIADNQLTINSKWDDQLLGEQLRELVALELNFNIEAIGFSVGEIDLRIEQLDSGKQEKADPADTSPIPFGPAVTRPGMTWLLDEHRLHCGNALEDNAFEASMAGNRADAVISDLPYNLKIDGCVSGLGAIQHREFAMASGEMSQEQFRQFLARTTSLMRKFSKSGSLHYLFMDWRHALDLQMVCDEGYTELKALCVWCKNAAGMGSFYRSQHELIFIYKSGKGRHRNNILLGVNGRDRTNVWNYPSANQLSTGEEGSLLALHPTSKPVRMLADAILDCTARRDLVLDPFVGSGSTLIAAERVGRRCCAIEIDPLYVDTAVRRWQAFSGRDAIDADTKLTFEQVTAAAGGNRG